MPHMQEQFSRLKDKGKDFIKQKKTRLYNAAEPTVHSHPSIEHVQSEASSTPGRSTDNRAAPNSSVVPSHGDSASRFEHSESATKAVLAKQSTKSEDDHSLPHKATRRSTFRLPYDKFRDEVTEEMEKHKIGFMNSNYLPDQSIWRLTREINITKIFPDASPQLVSYIAVDAPKTFLITLLTMQNLDDGYTAMEAFHRHNFTDKSCLPIRATNAPRQFAQEWSCSRDWQDEKSCCHSCEDSAGQPRHSICTHKPELDAFHHSCWALTSFKDFFKKQWHFLLQKFNVEEFQYEHLEDDRLLPFFIDQRTSDKGGNFSDVQRAWMLESYLELPEGVSCDPASPVSTNFPTFGNLQTEDSPKRVRIAVKTLKPMSEPGYNIAYEWKQEAKAHKALNKLQHQHIVKGLGAFCQRNRYHLILEWANGGNLRTFWKANPKPVFTKALVKDMLLQLRGLADALSSMHKTKAPTSRRSSDRSRDESPQKDVGIRDFQADLDSALTRLRLVERPRKLSFSSQLPTFRLESPEVTELSKVPTFELQNYDSSGAINGSAVVFDEGVVDGGQEENWRHGDIKPDNILRFVQRERGSDDSKDLGTLKLADLGRAKRHMEATIERGDIEIDKWHTRNYEPPDVFIHGKARTTSRLYDVWSLGCVFFEAMIWILYGRNEMNNYQITTEKRETEGSPYWTRSGPGGIGAVVSQMAALWMDTILKSDPECSGPDPSALRDLMLLIKDRMLVVKLPMRSDEYQDGCRTNAQDVLRELDDILKRAERSETYLFTGRNREGVKAPPSGPKANAELGIKHSQVVEVLDTIMESNGVAMPSPQLTVIGMAPSSTSMRRRSQYDHQLSDNWSYACDDDFSSTMLSKLMSEHDDDPSLSHRPVSGLCEKCSTFDPQDTETYQKRLKKDLNKTARKNCMLCKIVQEKANAAKIPPASRISLERSGGKLRINGKEDTAMRVCRSLPQIPQSAHQVHKPGALQSPLAMNGHDSVPIGLPALFVPGDEPHLSTLRAWLEDCDRHACLPAMGPTYCPRRLLYIGVNPDDPDKPFCQLMERKRLPGQGRNLKYMALSHPWGDPDKHQHFKSTEHNIGRHMAGIDESELPQNFQDAIEITRGLGCSYLWIDSICIRQASEHEDGDFQEEARHIQDVFGSAYCVIAASSTTGMDDGFLTARTQPSIVTLSLRNEDTGAPEQFHISSIIDDFEHDVEQGFLSQRGWVFQERALARRTMYFTKNQTYFECGRGIRCETLSKLKNDEAAFLGDPEFPEFGTKGQTMGAKLFLFTSLYEDYSRLEFTHHSDKPIAIAGLEQRLTHKFTDRSGAGVFADHKWRWLLWERADPNEGLKRIDFPPNMRQTPPSWSWMSYIGGINYIDPPAGQTTWNDNINLRLTGDGKTSWLYAEDSLTMTAPILEVTPGASEEIMASFSSLQPEAQRNHQPMSLILDSKRTEVPKHFVIIGTLGDQNDDNARTYVLALKYRPDWKAYERTGAGWIPHRMVTTGEFLAKAEAII